MTYLPGYHLTINKPIGINGESLDARSMFYDEETFTYRPFVSIQEILEYFNTSESRKGNFVIHLKLQDGTIENYWFNGGVDDEHLVKVVRDVVNDDESSDETTYSSEKIERRLDEETSLKANTADVYVKSEVYNKLESDAITAQTISSVSSGFKGVLYLEDPEPSEDGLYKPGESGIFLNAGGLSYDRLGEDKRKDVSFLKKGTAYTKYTIDLTDNNYDDADKSKVDTIDVDGDGESYLSNDGEYKKIVVPEAPVQGVSVNGEIAEPNDLGIVNINTLDTVEQTIDPNSTNPVSSRAVAAEFQQVSSKYGVALQLNESGEDEDKVYSMSLLDENGVTLSTSDEFKGGGGGGGGSATTKIVLTKLDDNKTVKVGDEVVLKYYFDHRQSDTDSSTGLQADVLVTILSGANSTIFEQTINADTINTLSVTNNMLIGNNTVRVKVSVDTGEGIRVSTISWKVQVVTLSLTSSYNFTSLIPRGEIIFIPYNLNGSGSKNLSLFIDGVKKEDRSIINSSANGSFSVDTSTLSHGSHSIQLVSDLIVSDTETIKSNSIYFDIAVTEVGNTTPIVATRFDYIDGSIVGAGERPYVNTKQFEEYTIRYAGYNPTQAQNKIDVTINGSLISSIVSDFSQRVLTTKSAESGQMNGVINIGLTNYTFGLNVNDSDILITEPTDNLQLKLTALGRTNSDSNKESWTYKTITTTITNVQYSGDGWVDNALKLTNGGKAVINYKPLASNAIQNSFAFQTKFRASDVSDVNASIISCVHNGIGFIITPEGAKMVSGGNSEVVMILASGRTYNIAFVSHPVATSNSSDYEKLNSNMLYLYIDGIISGGVQRGTTDSIYQAIPQNITIEGIDSTVDVYTVRSYNNYLSDNQVLDLYMLDLDNVDELLTKYNSNDVIDSEGFVTVEILPDDMRYIIITGQADNGMSTVQYAQSMNDKNARYDTSEILHIKRSQPELNWKCVGGSIRLQGTSSLAYPIKNFRVYFRSATSGSSYGRVYKGVDAHGNGGELVSGTPKISFKNPDAKGKIPAPVNVWCLKADFAESSSSHNTGMARLVNDTLVQSNKLTPAQRLVTSSHPYDVRTTVDGEPCYLFYRKTVVDKPVFVGKYNMNNDKSTEAVFGFLDIPGYHDAPWVADKFGGKNPTECWEFLNNDFPMGSFLDDDFDKKEPGGLPSWMLVFESRFPDNNEIYESGEVRPFHLERFVKWVKSTEGNPTKFKNELKDYANIDYLCSYFAFTQLFGAVDQMVKNCFIGFWYNPDVDKVLAYYIFYDNDTIMGVRNDGRLKYNWDIDRNTLDPELTISAGKDVYAFAGHDSVIWNNLSSQFPDEIKTAYTQLRANMSNDYIFNKFDKEQSLKFAERIYNLDSQYKYIGPKTIGIDVISGGVPVNTKYSYMEAMQGSRASHRRWWLTNRLELFDARYSTGQYPQTDISWKGISDIGATVRATPSRDFYFEFKREGSTMAKSFVEEGVEWSYSYDQTANVGTIFHLYGGKFILKLNLSDWGGFTDMNLPTLPVVEELILGKTGKTYTLSEVVIGDKMPMLKTIDITNYTNIPTMNLSGCKRLETVKATGCTGMASIELPTGAPITSLILPTALKTLSIKGLPYITNGGITFPSGNGIDNLIVESSPLLDWEVLYTSLGSVKNIRITNINKTGDIAFLDKYKNLGGIDSYGLVTATPRLSGTFQCTTYLEDTIYENYKAIFPELVIKQPEYSKYTMYLDVPSSKFLYNDDNGTGYDPNLVVQTNPYVLSGHLKSIVNGVHRYLGKHSRQGVMSITKLHDNDTTKFADGTPAVIDGSNGDIWTKFPRYWYKGVKDILNNKAYFFVSSNYERPSSPNGIKVLKQSDIQETRTGFYIDVTSSNISNSYITDNRFRTHKYHILDGFEKLRMCLAPFHPTKLPNIGALFLDENEQIVGTVNINYSLLAPGPNEYIIRSIPEGAKYLITCSMVNQGADEIGDVILGYNNTPIEDFEPDWVLRDEFLLNTVTPSLDSANKLRSKSNQSGTLTAWLPNSYQDNIDKLNARAFSMVTYEKYKDIIWLTVFKYGDTRVKSIVGTGSSTLVYGRSLKYGMKDTVNNGYYVTDAIGQVEFVSIGYPSILGVETFWCVNAYANNLTEGHSSFGNPNTSSFFRINSSIEGKNRTIGFTPGASRDMAAPLYQGGQATSAIYINLGKYMDIFPSGATYKGDSTTYFGSRYDGFAIYQYPEASSVLKATVGFFVDRYAVNPTPIQINTLPADGLNYGQNIKSGFTWNHSIEEVASKVIYNSLIELA